jgi:plastocyanin
MMRLRPPSRSGPVALAMIALAACGGGGGPSDDPGGGGTTRVFQKPVGSGDAQTGTVEDTLPIPLTVLMTEGGVPAAGWVVTFAPLAGAGNVVPAVDTTGVDGLATTSWTLGTLSGLRQVQATASGAGVTPLIFTATVQPAPPAALAANGGTGQVQEVGFPFAAALTVRITDPFGNNVPGVAVQWQVVSGSVSLGAATSNTAGNGIAAVSVLAGGSPGGAQVRAVAIALPADTVTFGLNVIPASSVITVNNNFFSPAVDTILAGATIRWVWNGGTHDVSPVSGPELFPASGVRSFPDQYGPVAFTIPGTYLYQCNLHDGMTGTIVVQ